MLYDASSATATAVNSAPNMRLAGRDKGLLTVAKSGEGDIDLVLDATGITEVHRDKRRRRHGGVRFAQLRKRIRQGRTGGGGIPGLDNGINDQKSALCVPYQPHGHVMSKRIFNSHLRSRRREFV